jgi:hypothetical protein
MASEIIETIDHAADQLCEGSVVHLAPQRLPRDIFLKNF